MSSSINSLLREIAEKQGIENFKIEMSDGSENGDGYLGIMTSAKILGKNNGEDVVLSLIIKAAPTNDALRSKAPIVNVYNREIYMYDKVLRLFENFEKEKGLPPSRFAPKFYKAQKIDKNEALVLENLKHIDYKLFELRMSMDQNHVGLVMKEYGRLHALSFAIRDQRPELFKQVTERLTDDFVLFAKTDKFLHNTCFKAQKALNLETDKEAVLAYKDFVLKLDEFYDELLKPLDNYAVALHGDCWTNNMMFKYENDDRPTKVCFLDFQLARLGSPVLDLVYFFYACSSKEIIDNMEHYRQLYYNSLSTYLRKLGSNADKIFPYSVLENHWKKYARYGLILSALTILTMFTEKNEIVNLSDAIESDGDISNAFTYEIANIDKYHDRIRHIVLHLVKNKFM